MAEVVDTGLVALCREVERALPSGVVIECGSSGDGVGLFSAEAVAISDWEPSRRLQFETGRACARRGMKRLGLHGVPILFDTDGAPVWPPGVVGSISHKREHCIAVVGLSSDCAGIGVDLERNVADAAEAELLRRVCPTEAEKNQVQLLAEVTRSPGTLLLAAKEAFFKFQFPATRAWLDWDEVEVEANGVTFSARAPCAKAADVGLLFVSGRWIAAVYWRPFSGRHR